MQRRPPSLSAGVISDALPVKLLPGFWFGSYRSALNRAALESLGIRSILNLSGREELSLEWGASSGVQCRTVHLRDLESARLLECVDTDGALEFIASGIDSGGILVHCNAGRSRSPAVAALWLMSTHGKTLDEALALTKEKRPCVDINRGFLEQLRLFESCGHNLRVAANMWERKESAHAVERVESVSESVPNATPTSGSDCGGSASEAPCSRGVTRKAPIEGAEVSGAGEEEGAGSSVAASRARRAKRPRTEEIA